MLYYLLLLHPHFPQLCCLQAWHHLPCQQNVSQVQMIDLQVGDPFKLKVSVYGINMVVVVWNSIPSESSVIFYSLINDIWTAKHTFQDLGNGHICSVALSSMTAFVVTQSWTNSPSF